MKVTLYTDGEKILKKIRKYKRVERDFPSGPMVKYLPAMQETQV